MSDRPSFRRVEAFLGEVVAAGVASSVVGLIATAEEIAWEGTAGEARAGVPTGTATRFEPGQTREVRLVAYAGARRVVGFTGAVNGPL